MLILVDAMGGDNAPDAVVNGCIEALIERQGFEILLIGDSTKIESILKEKNFKDSRLNIKHASEIITNEDSPTKAIRSKKDSSMAVGLKMIKEGNGDVFLSAGNTGALLAGSLLILGRIKGVDRPSLAPLIPTKNGLSLIIDGGANSVCKPINFLQFGIMGSLYMQDVFGIEKPKVGLINVGSEESKGNDVIKQSFELLSNANINFIGNVEAHQIPEGRVNVAVCDGFVGNVFLKTVEGIAVFIQNEFLRPMFKKNIITKFAALLVKDGLMKFKKTMDTSEYGSVPLLGVDGKVMKTHGRSDSKAFKNSIYTAHKYAQSKITEEIKLEFENLEVEDNV